MPTYYAPSRSYGRVASSTRTTPVDLYRDGDTYVLSADLPGIDPTTVDVDIEGKVMTISASRPARSTDGITWLTAERPTGSVRRQFTLGDGVDSSQISASYDNGVLNVVVPVSERAKPRKVAVTTSPVVEAAPVDEAAVAA
jgi:HSP20 family protein